MFDSRLFIDAYATTTGELLIAGAGDSTAWVARLDANGDAVVTEWGSPLDTVSPYRFECFADGRFALFATQDFIDVDQGEVVFGEYDAAGTFERGLKIPTGASTLAGSLGESIAQLPNGDRLVALPTGPIPQSDVQRLLIPAPSPMPTLGCAELHPPTNGPLTVLGTVATSTDRATDASNLIVVFGGPTGGVATGTGSATPSAPIEFPGSVVEADACGP